MTKTPILVAICATTVIMFNSISAHAESTIYAQIQFEMARIDNGTSADTYITDRERGRIGIKGSKDAGNGITSFGIAEFDFVGGNDDSEFGDARDTDTGGDSVTVRGNALRVREIAAGLKGPFGIIEVGTLKSAYKYTGGIKYDPFVTTTLEARGNYGMSGGATGHNSFINNAVAYKNKFGPVNIWVTYSPDDTDTDNDGKSDAGQISYAVRFSGDNFEAFLSGVDSGTSFVQYSTNKLGGKFDIRNGMSVMGQYEMIDRNGIDEAVLYLGFQMKQGKNKFSAAYGQTDLDDGFTNDADGTYMNLGMIHLFSESARVFTGYRSKQGDGSLDSTILTVGLRVEI